MKKICFNQILLASVALGMSNGITFAGDEKITHANDVLTGSQKKDTLASLKAAPTAPSKPTAPKTTVPSEPTTAPKATAPSKPTESKPTSPSKPTASALKTTKPENLTNDDSTIDLDSFPEDTEENLEELRKAFELHSTEFEENESELEDEHAGEPASVESIKEKVAIEKVAATPTPATPATDKPTLSTSNDTDIDTNAKAMLEIADNHRNHRTHFSALESWNEALRLYREVATTQLAISPDLKARAIINLSEMTVWSPFGPTALDKKLEAVQHITEITHNTSCSPDVKGWAKRHLAKLYMSGDLDLEPMQARKQALTLLEEVIADATVLEETKARAMIQLAEYYARSKFEIAAKEALEKATKLLTDVFMDKNVRHALRIHSKMLLASIVNPYDDTHNQKRLTLLNEIIADTTNAPSEKAAAKEKLAQYYLENVFDVTPVEARTKAHALLKELAEDTGLSNQENLKHYVQLAEHYLHIKLDLKPTESRAQALKMYQELPSKIQLNIAQNYIYQKELAHYCVTNAFHQDPIASKQIAFKLYQSLINDESLPIQQRAEIFWIVANLYITKQLDPQTGIDGKVEGLALIKRVINDQNVGIELINQLKLNLAILYERNAFEILPSKSKEEAASLLNELLNSNTISMADKQKIQEKLDMLNKTA